MGRRNSRKRRNKPVGVFPSPYSKTPDYPPWKEKKRAKRNFQPATLKSSNGLIIRVEEGDNTKNGRAVLLNIIQHREPPFWQFWVRRRKPLHVHLNQKNASRLARVLALIGNR